MGKSDKTGIFRFFISRFGGIHDKNGRIIQIFCTILFCAPDIFYLFYICLVLIHPRTKIYV